MFLLKKKRFNKKPDLSGWNYTPKNGTFLPSKAAINFSPLGLVE